MHKKFYMYDFDDLNVHIDCDYDRSFYDRWCKESFSALYNHENRVENPDEADYFVVTQTLRTTSFVGFNLKMYLSNFLSNNEYWHDGRPHVFFDIRDSPRPLIYDPRATVCKTAFHEYFFDPRLHVSIPQFPRQRFEEKTSPVGDRKYLIGFKGHPRAEKTDLRTRLFKFHNNDDIIIVPGIYPKDTAEEYNNILRNSKFALLPRADGYALSYRMVECMNLGCIPVIISDGYVLPFHSEIDYSSFSIRIKEDDIDNLEIILKKQQNLEYLQRKAEEIFTEYFSSTDKIINYSLKLAEKNLGPLKRNQHFDWGVRPSKQANSLEFKNKNKRKNA